MSEPVAGREPAGTNHGWEEEARQAVAAAARAMGLGECVLCLASLVIRELRPVIAWRAVNNELYAQARYEEGYAAGVAARPPLRAVRGA